MNDATIVGLCILAFLLEIITFAGRSRVIGAQVFVILLGISMLAYLVTRIIRHRLTIIDILASILFIVLFMIAIFSAVYTLTHLR